MVIFHSYVSLPEGSQSNLRISQVPGTDQEHTLKNSYKVVFPQLWVGL